MNRSVTAEQLFKYSKKYRAKSCGLGFLCDVKADENLVKWADIVFVMNEKDEGQKSFLLEKFKNIDGIRKKIKVLGIRDDYPRNSPELIGELKRKLKKYI
ncbi:MAG: hypothetical protein HY606_14035 [Planctomycetes bacterium]|nr:hypothetical protein [Planctomycetota bacterium]